MLRRAAPLALALFAACSIHVAGGASSLDGGGAAGAPEAGSGSGGLVDDSSFGGTGGAEASDAPDAPSLPYGFRQRLHVTAGPAGVPAGASIHFAFDHQALVLAGKARSDGKDVRIFEKPATGLAVELDRVVDPLSAWNTSDTTLWFKAVNAISGQPDSSYYLYYGDDAASAPPADGNGVFLFWDDFDGTGLAPGWTAGPVGSATGTIAPSGGMLHFDGATGDIWNQGDDFLFAYRSASGDFVADARVAKSAGALSGWAKVGGLMLRQSTDRASRNRIVSPVNGGAALTNSSRTIDGAVTVEDTVGGPNPIPVYVELDRVGETSRAFYSDDGKSWSELGSAVTFTNGLADPVLVGVPFANISGAKGQVDVDWFRIRVFVAADPVVSRDAEEPGPFTL